MYSQVEYQKLKKKWGMYSSWAVWNEDDQKDTSVIDNNFACLNTKVVFVGLNISKPLKTVPWSNFRTGRHDWKLMRACNTTSLKGSYLTDIFKGIPEADSVTFKRKVKDDLSLIKKNVVKFHIEMRDVGVTKNTTFVLLGGLTSWFFSKYFKTQYPNNRILNYCHYSYYGGLTAKIWVEELWSLLGIDGTFEKTITTHKSL